MLRCFFTFESSNITIQCSKNDGLIDIYQKFAIKVDKNIKDLYFLYGGNVINLELKFNQIINLEDNNRNEIIVLAFEK